jgi:hypothetical protein
VALKPPDLIQAGINVGSDPERILIFGPAGGGKTEAWLTIADLMQKLGSGEHFYVADTDQAVRRSMSAFGHLENVTVTQCNDFRAYKTWARETRDVVNPGDWVVTDTASTGYEQAQRMFFDKKYGMTRDELEFERAFSDAYANRKGPLIEPDDWIMIRNAFLGLWEHDIVLELSTKRGAHLFATAEPKQIFDHFENPQGRPKADNSAWLDYGQIGLRPDGHKSLDHKVHTIMLIRRTNVGHYVSYIKDRGERSTSQLIVRDSKEGGFAMDYLLSPERANWSVVAD